MSKSSICFFIQQHLELSRAHPLMRQLHPIQSNKWRFQYFHTLEIDGLILKF